MLKLINIVTFLLFMRYKYKIPSKMNIVQIYKKFPNEKTCIKHLEQVRWNNCPICPYCKSENNYPMPKELYKFNKIKIPALQDRDIANSKPL